MKKKLKNTLKIMNNIQENLHNWEEQNRNILEIGTIFHIVTLESVEKAYELYPHQIDYILDLMNSNFYKSIKELK